MLFLAGLYFCRDSYYLDLCLLIQASSARSGQLVANLASWTAAVPEADWGSIGAPSRHQGIHGWFLHGLASNRAVQSARGATSRESTPWAPGPSRPDEVKRGAFPSPVHSRAANLAPGPRWSQTLFFPGDAPRELLSRSIDGSPVRPPGAPATNGRH